jgi:hypothetical protein
MQPLLTQKLEGRQQLNPRSETKNVPKKKRKEKRYLLHGILHGTIPEC